MKQEMKFRIERRNGQWVIDPENSSVPVTFDQAIVDATLVEEGAVEGYITSVHGLSEQIANLCDGKVLRALGVGAQLCSQKPPGAIRAKGMARVRLTERGLIERIGGR